MAFTKHSPATESPASLVQTFHRSLMWSLIQSLPRFNGSQLLYRIRCVFGRSHSIFDGWKWSTPNFWGSPIRFPAKSNHRNWDWFRWKLCTSPMRFGLGKKDTSFSSSENMTGSGQIRIFHQPILVDGFIPSEKYESKWVHLPQFSGWN